NIKKYFFSAVLTPVWPRFKKPDSAVLARSTQALFMLSAIQLQNICTSCGACCAHFRVSFYWAEGERIPEALQEPLTPIYNCMAGTNRPKPRCVALEGT